jgi:glutamate carboxypeptidase
MNNARLALQSPGAMRKMKRIVRILVLVSVAVVSAAAQAAGQPDQAVQQAVQASRAGALELLKNIVNIDSGSGDIAGGERVEALLAERLKKIGAQVRTQPAEVNSVAPNLVAVFRGSGRTRVLIICHIDTVFAPGTVAKRPFRVEGDRAYGPGVGDEKAGVVNAVTTLELLHQLGFRDYGTITLLIDGSEELGSPGSTQLIRTLAKQHDVEFNMEPGDPPDAVTVWRKGGGDITVQVHGRAAHAGMVPQDGRNAVLELLHQLSVLQALFPQTGDGVTVNLTVLKTGDRTNIIPDFAQGTFDVRFRKPAEFDAVLARMKSAVAPTVIPDTTVTVASEGTAYPPLIESEQIEALGKRAQSIYAELGKTLGLSGNGGASESAVSNSVGTPALDGLGYVGTGFHTDHEYIEVGSITPRTYLFTRLLMETCRNGVPKAAAQK